MILSSRLSLQGNTKTVFEYLHPLPQLLGMVYLWVNTVT